jgi:hypothetical protein
MSEGYPKQKFKIDVYKNESPGLFEFLEGFFYEIKPFLYLSFSVWVVHSHFSEAWWLKIACMGIIIFSFLTLFSRLSYRGYLE